MTPIEKAKWLAEFWAQIAEGKTAQVYNTIAQSWNDIPTDNLTGPNAKDDHKPWRIKPEPRRKWEINGHETYEEKKAAEWKARGFTVTEWLEVV